MLKAELLNLSEDFRQQAEDAWSADTAFGGQYDPQNISRNQCGITSYGMGLWLVQEKGLDPHSLLYSRGYLFDLRGPQGVLPISDNHSWLCVPEDAGPGWSVDLTPDQYPGITDRYIVQRRGMEPGDPYLYAAAEGSLTSLDEYDTSRFGGRLEAFARALGLRLLG